MWNILILHGAQLWNATCISDCNPSECTSSKTTPEVCLNTFFWTKWTRSAYIYKISGFLISLLVFLVYPLTQKWFLKFVKFWMRSYYTGKQLCAKNLYKITDFFQMVNYYWNVLLHFHRLPLIAERKKSLTRNYTSVHHI